MGEEIKKGVVEDETCGIRMVHFERVSRAKQEALDEYLIDRLSHTFKLMGDPTRLKIIVALNGGEMCVCDIAAFIGLSESAVSHQLRRLRDLSLVKTRRDGQILYYSLAQCHVPELLNTGIEHISE